VAVAPVPRIGAPTDAVLMAQIAAGDLTALGELYQRHRTAVRQFALRATCKHDDAEDVLHDTFLTAARIAERYDGRDSCRPWLIGIAARLTQQRSQKLARLARYLSRLASLHRTSEDPRPALDARSELARALDRMSAAKRVVILMAEVEGMTCPEIAEALEIRVGTVWTRLHHARRELRAAIEAR
jgi:RNA polymerase sigma factor (sigma-70 family)